MNNDQDQVTHRLIFYRKREDVCSTHSIVIEYKDTKEKVWDKINLFKSLNQATLYIPGRPAFITGWRIELPANTFEILFLSTDFNNTWVASEQIQGSARIVEKL